MDLSNLKPAKGSTKKSKRIGRGQGSGKGGTSTRGHKGAGARSGTSYKAGFEGGQMPLQRRIPKYGFKNPNRVEYNGINLSTLEKLANEKNITEFTIEVFVQNGLASKKDLIKILGKGELTRQVKVTAHGFSKTAKEVIEAKGGVAEQIILKKEVSEEELTGLKEAQKLKRIERKKSI
jgi:large subunit ribosomal protein L15